jgi:hypothetical protein
MAVLRTSHIKKENLKISPQGAWGSPNLFHPKSYFSCDLKPHAKFQNPMIAHSGREVTQNVVPTEIWTPLPPRNK